MAEFIIIFREVLEAGLIIGILYTYLNKVDQQSSIARMWSLGHPFDIDGTQ